jgi:hypothetical protein
LANHRPETGTPRESRLAGDIRRVVAGLAWPRSGIGPQFFLRQHLRQQAGPQPAQGSLYDRRALGEVAQCVLASE